MESESNEKKLYVVCNGLKNEAEHMAAQVKVAVENGADGVFLVNKFENETKSLTEYLDKLKLEVLDLKNLASDSVIAHAQLSIDDLQKKLTVAAEETAKTTRI